jgi:tryptophan-rich sensory protein
MRYRSLDEVSQNHFSIDPEFKPVAWLIIPVLLVLGFLMTLSAIETFETGQTYAKGGRVLLGEAAYLHALFGVYAIAWCLLALFRGPKWYSLFKRVLLAGLTVILVWSIVAQVLATR